MGLSDRSKLDHTSGQTRAFLSLITHLGFDAHDVCERSAESATRRCPDLKTSDMRVFSSETGNEMLPPVATKVSILCLDGIRVWSIFRLQAHFIDYDRARMWMMNSNSGSQCVRLVSTIYCSRPCFINIAQVEFEVWLVLPVVYYTRSTSIAYAVPCPS